MRSSQHWKDALHQVRHQYQSDMSSVKALLGEHRQVVNAKEQALELLKVEERRQLEELKRRFERESAELQQAVRVAKAAFEAQEVAQLQTRERLQAEVDALFFRLLEQSQEALRVRPETVDAYRREEARRLALAEQHPELREQLGEYSRLQRQVKAIAESLRPVRDDLADEALLHLARMVSLKPAESQLMEAIEAAGLNEDLQLVDGEVVLAVAFHQGHVRVADGGDAVREFFLVLPLPESTLDVGELGLSQILALAVAEALVELQVQYGDASLELEAEQLEQYLVYRVQCLTSDTDAEICFYLQETLQERVERHPELSELELTLTPLTEFAPTLLRNLASWDHMEELEIPAESREVAYA